MAAACPGAGQGMGTGYNPSYMGSGGQQPQQPGSACGNGYFSANAGYGGYPWASGMYPGGGYGGYQGSCPVPPGYAGDVPYAGYGGMGPSGYGAGYNAGYNGAYGGGYAPPAPGGYGAPNSYVPPTNGYAGGSYTPPPATYGGFPGGSGGFPGGCGGPYNQYAMQQQYGGYYQPGGRRSRSSSLNSRRYRSRGCC
mmetsp:Transcript_106894/g.319604  ORF Transcript_106894/g.319604 Transcript_106894/m.319604 type:complete len:195 (-) Transcript_106894:143-727(-)